MNSVKNATFKCVSVFVRVFVRHASCSDEVVDVEGRDGVSRFWLLPPRCGRSAASWTKKPPRSAGASGSAVLAGVHRGPAPGAPGCGASFLHTDHPHL